MNAMSEVVVVRLIQASGSEKRRGKHSSMQ